MVALRRSTGLGATETGGGTVDLTAHDRKTLTF